MRGVFQNLQFSPDQILEHLVLLDFVFANYFDCTFQICQPVNRNSYLTKTTLTYDSSYFVPELYVEHFFESFEVLEVQDVEKLVVGGHVYVDCRQFTYVVHAATFGQYT